jgi:hypothetical protein
MKEKKTDPLAKAIRDDRQNRIACVITGVMALSATVFMLRKAYAAADEFISMLPLKETSLVFTFAFAAFSCVGFFAVAIPFLMRAAMVGPQLKSNTLLLERIEQLERQIAKESERDNDS